MPTLQLYDVSKAFGPTVALEGVKLDVAPGEIHALIGENGAGKSTLLNILAGSIRPDRGCINIDGQAYAPNSPQDARRQGIALIHQELSLFPHLTVAENILVGNEPTRPAAFGWLDRTALFRRAHEVLAEFGHPEIDPRRRVMDLSIAARQVVEICRAVASRASIVLMDEPTSSLQRADVERLFTFIRRLSQERVSVIYISHFLEEVREIADTFTVLRDGRSVASGKLSSTTDDELVTHMVGRPVEQLFPDRLPAREITPVALEVENLQAPPAVKSASFSLRRGEILGIAGLMGAGRTEMVRAIFGLDRMSTGTVTVKGKAFLAGEQIPRQSLRYGVGYLSEDRAGEGLALALSIADNVTLANFSTCANRWGWLDLARQREQVTNWITRLSVRAQNSEQPARSLSGGNQQKVALSRLLHQQADILMLDEPTRGIDIGSKAQIYQVIADCAGANKAVLMVSSYLPELFGMCDRLAVMTRGRLSVARPIREWTPESIMQAAVGDGRQKSTLQV
ncbi:MAG TPA: sugar ABC transporter ATP-binding protein [Pyrinomonadaceae bacterium]